MEQTAGSEKGTEYEKNNRKTAALRYGCKGNYSKFCGAGSHGKKM